MATKAIRKPWALAGGLAPLRHRNFALFWLGALISNIGNWMETIAAGVLVTETTQRAGWTGLVAVAGFLPNALFGLFGGAFADRFERKKLLIVTNTLELFLAALLALFAARGMAAPLTVTMILFASGCVGALGFPAYQAILPDLVPQEDLLGAIALSSAQWNLGRVIGPAVAGAAIFFGGYAWAFSINALTFLAVIAVLLTITLPLPHPKTGEALLQRIAEGLRFARRDLSIRTAIAALALFSLLAGPFIALVAAMAIKVLHVGSNGTVSLVTAQGIGAVVIGFLLSPLAERYSRHRVLLTTCALLPPTLILYAASPSLWVAIVLIMVLGGLYLSLLSGLSTVVQLRTPSALRGRVMSLNSATLSTCFPLGSIGQGVLADHFGQRAVTTGAALILALILLIARLRRWHIGLVNVERWELLPGR